MDHAKLSAFCFASRKEPEFMCHRLVQCPVCDLVYVDQPPSADELAQAYHVAEYDSSEEVSDDAMVYMRALDPTLQRLVRRERALAIGTGTGTFLEQLSRAGFSELVGIEPSSAVIAAAPPYRRSWIRETIFHERDFAPASFDLICCFMTMEHACDPQVAFRLLRPGGAFVTVKHDSRGLVNRLLGGRSPIVDIEHVQLCSTRSMHYLFAALGYANVTVHRCKQLRRSLLVTFDAGAPWAKAGPFGSGGSLHADRIKIGVYVGNLITAGFKKTSALSPVRPELATGVSG